MIRSLQHHGRLLTLAAAIVLVAVACSGGDTVADSGVAATATAVSPTATAVPATPTDAPAETTETAAAEPTETAAPQPTEAPVEPTETAAPQPTEAPVEPDGSEDETTESQAPEPAPALEGVLTDIVADAQGGRAFFDGTVNEIGDLEDLVADAWGDGGLGLHRGHAQVENVLEAFLGIDHDAMHDYMDQGMNLAATAEAVGQNPDALIETLTYSYMPFVFQGVDNDIITTEQAEEWVGLLRTEFTDRVYWDGVSAS